MQHYMKNHNISKDFIILKEFTVICKLENKTQFPIKLISDKMSEIKFPILHDSSLTTGPSNRNNNLIIYPGEQAGLTMSFMTSVDVKLNQEFSVNIFLNYATIFGRKSKAIKSYFSPEDKIFVIYD